MRVLVAAQAGLLQLNRRAGGYPELRQVLLYPGAFIVDRIDRPAPGLVREARQVLAGESWQQGRVVLSWDDVVAGAADPDDGRNVVIHEFAHQLDQESGPANGAPFLGDRAHYPGFAGDARAPRYADVSVVDSRRPPGFHRRPYGASSPAEFFAVASEVFFERPQALADDQPALYRELARPTTGVDPLSW